MSNSLFSSIENFNWGKIATSIMMVFYLLLNLYEHSEIIFNNQYPIRKIKDENVYAYLKEDKLILKNKKGKHISFFCYTKNCGFKNTREHLLTEINYVYIYNARKSLFSKISEEIYYIERICNIEKECTSYDVSSFIAKHKEEMLYRAKFDLGLAAIACLIAIFAPYGRRHKSFAISEIERKYNIK